MGKAEKKGQLELESKERCYLKTKVERDFSEMEKWRWFAMAAKAKQSMSRTVS